MNSYLRSIVRHHRPAWQVGAMLLLVAGVFAAAGCSSCTGRAISPGGDGASGDALVDAAVDGASRGDANQTADGSGTDSDDVADCPASRTCGGQCCSSDESCVDGRCLPPCSGTRCGAKKQQCCTGKDICLYEKCVTPGKSCQHSRQCPKGKICQRQLQKCVPEPNVQCKYKPGTQVFSPKVDRAWKGDSNTPAPSYNQVMMTPTVADVDGSGTPDIVFSTFRGGDYNSESVIRIIDGKTYKPIAHLTDSNKRVQGSSTIAIGDIDTDQRNELVAVRPGSAEGLMAIDDHTTNWKVMWKTSRFQMHWDSAALADLNADGSVEVVGANRVYAGATGKHLCTASGISGNPKNSTAVDIDGDGDLEVVAANGIFDFAADGSGGYKCTATTTFGATGYPAVGDFGTFQGGTQFGVPDGKPEVALVVPRSGGTVQLYDPRTGKQIWSSSIPNGGHPHFSQSRCNGEGAGPPTVADFDGDDEPEVATAGACFYAVFETDGSLLWKHPSQDFSSSQTGSSVFDFQGDGKAEAVYADECFIRVYKGSGNGNGKTSIFFKRAHSSGTTRELPVIVDVDKDFNSEIVLISNDYSGVSSRCKQKWPKYSQLGGGGRGVLVIEDKKNRWVPTRPVWNQHAYQVTNVCSGDNAKLCTGRKDRPGAIPVGQKSNWKTSYLNNFRQNVQGEGVFDAPDLKVSQIQVANLRCNQSGLTVDVEVEVTNRGARAVPAGAKVAVYSRTGSGTSTKIGTAKTTRLLLPGQSETVKVTWNVPKKLRSGSVDLRAVVDPDGQFNECKENNNETTTTVKNLSSRAPNVPVKSISVTDSGCGRSGTITVRATIENAGSVAVPKGTPVVMTAVKGGSRYAIGTVKTKSALRPGNTTTVKKSWNLANNAKALVGDHFEVVVEVDPNQTKVKCGGGRKKTQAQCATGG